MRHTGFLEAGVPWSQGSTLHPARQCLPCATELSSGGPTGEGRGHLPGSTCQGHDHDTAFLARWVSYLLLFEVNLVPDLN